MPEQAPEKIEKKTGHISPFEIEVSTKNSAAWKCKTLNEKLRGSWSVNKLGTMAGSISAAMRAMPDIPGLRLSIKCNREGGGTVEIWDPLKDDPERLDKISAVWSGVSWGFRSKYKAKATSLRTLDKDTFVTFLWELRKIQDGVETTFEVVSGQLPTAKEIESLPGRELNEMHSPYPHSRYKEDTDQYALFQQFQSMMRNRAAAG